MVSFATLNIPEPNFLMTQSLSHCILNVRKIKMISSDTPLITGFSWLSSCKLLLLSTGFKNCSTSIVEKKIHYFYRRPEPKALCSNAELQEVPGNGRPGLFQIGISNHHVQTVYCLLGH